MRPLRPRFFQKMAQIFFETQFLTHKTHWNGKSTPRRYHPPTPEVSGCKRSFDIATSKPHTEKDCYLKVPLYHTLPLSLDKVCPLVGMCYLVGMCVCGVQGYTDVCVCLRWMRLDIDDIVCYHMDMIHTHTTPARTIRTRACIACLHTKRTWRQRRGTALMLLARAGVACLFILPASLLGWLLGSLHIYHAI